MIINSLKCWICRIFFCTLLRNQKQGKKILQKIEMMVLFKVIPVHFINLIANIFLSMTLFMLEILKIIYIFSCFHVSKSKYQMESFPLTFLGTLLIPESLPEGRNMSTGKNKNFNIFFFSYFDDVKPFKVGWLEWAWTIGVFFSWRKMNMQWFWLWKGVFLVKRTGSFHWLHIIPSHLPYV